MVEVGALKVDSISGGFWCSRSRNGSQCIVPSRPLLSCEFLKDCFSNNRAEAACNKTYAKTECRIKIRNRLVND